MPNFPSFKNLSQGIKNKVFWNSSTNVNSYASLTLPPSPAVTFISKFLFHQIFSDLSKVAISQSSMPNDHLEMGGKKHIDSQKGLINGLLLVKHTCTCWGLSDMGKNKSKISILIAHWRGSRGIMEVSDYLSVTQKKLSNSRSVSLSLWFFFFLILVFQISVQDHYNHWFFFVIRSATRLVYLFLGV